MSVIRNKLESIIKEFDRVAILIDGHTTHNATRSIDMKVDWNKFQTFFTEIGRVRNINYYLTVTNVEVDSNEFDLDIDTVKLVGEDKPWWYSVINWMSYNNFNVVLKRGREFTFSDTGHIGIKTGIDMTIALDSMKLVNVDHVIFVTGNTEHTEIVKALQSKGIIVTVIGNSHKRIQTAIESGKLELNDDRPYPFTVSKRLIKASNYFIDFLDLAQHIE